MQDGRTDRQTDTEVMLNQRQEVLLSKLQHILVQKKPRRNFNMCDYLWQLEGKCQEKTEEVGNKCSTDINNHMFHNYSLMLKEFKSDIFS